MLLNNNNNNNNNDNNNNKIIIIIIIIIMYIYHALINAVSAHMILINLNMIFYTHVMFSDVG